MGRLFPRLALACLAGLAGGCQATQELPAASGAAFDPIAFFSGRTEGRGQLTKLFSSPAAMGVKSWGRVEGETLVLDQVISEGGKPSRVRRWTMRRVGSGRYTGALTDAAGPVEVDVLGARAEVRYTMKNGLKVDQQLALQADGRTLLNRLSVRKFGVRVALLNETIRKLE